MRSRSRLAKRIQALLAFLACIFLVPSQVTVASAASLRSVPLDGASSIIESGSHLWVANDSGHALVVELSVAGSTVRVFSARPGHKWITGPDAMAVSGSELWLANKLNNEVLEFSVLDGKLIRIIRAKTDHFSFPIAIAVSGSDVWVANSNNDSLTELSAADGRLIRVVGAQQGKFAGPLAIAVAKNRVFVTNGRDNSMTELDASNGTFIHLFGEGGRLGHPNSLVILGSDIWVEGRYVLNEINIASGVLVKSFNFKSDVFNVLEGVAGDDSNIWIDDFKSVTKIDSLNGSAELKVNPPTHYGANSLKGIALTREAVWVTNIDSVIELDARNGSVLRVVR